MLEIPGLDRAVQRPLVGRRLSTGATTTTLLGRWLPSLSGRNEEHQTAELYIIIIIIKEHCNTM